MYQIYHGSFHTVSKPRYQMFYTMFVQKNDDIVSDERNCVTNLSIAMGRPGVWAKSGRTLGKPDSALLMTIVNYGVRFSTNSSWP